MKLKNVTEIYSQLAKGTFLEQDRTSNFPNENIKSWEAYCEARLNLSNQDDVGENAPWLDCTDGFKDLPDEDADLIDSGSKVG